MASQKNLWVGDKRNAPVDWVIRRFGSLIGFK